MTTLPATANLNGATVTQGVYKVAIGDLRNVVAELLGGSAAGSFPIASGIITPTVATFAVDTEASAGADDLDYINPTNMPSGRIIILHSTHASRVVTLKHNKVSTGRLVMQDGQDAVLNNTSRWMMFVHNAGAGQWEEVMRSWTANSAYGNQIVAVSDAAGLLALINATARTDSSIYAIAAGTNVIVVTPTPAVSTLVDGMPVVFRTANANTGTCTLQVGTTAAKPLQHANGDPLASGDLPAGMIVEARYQATADVWRICSASGSAVKKTGDTMTGQLIGTTFKSNGTGATATGFLLSSGVDIGTLFINGATNLGGTQGVFAAKSGQTLQFKGITISNANTFTNSDSGTGKYVSDVTIGITSDANQIIISITRQYTYFNPSGGGGV